MTMLANEAAARAILARNDRGGYTVPTERLYPFQWNWDSAFVAMGFATLRRGPRLSRAGAPDRGPVGRRHDPAHRVPCAERHLFSRPGRVGHAASHPDLRHHPAAGLRHGPAPCSRGGCRSGDRADATARTKALFQAALRSHRWWLAARDPEGLGLVSILHPWESGSDNSPAWDAALARVPTTTTTTIRRKDTGHVDASMRPRDEDYQRFIHLVDTYRDCGWDPKRQWAAAPFKIADVQMTAILARSTADLMHLAESSARRTKGGARAHARQAARGSLARWRPALSRFVNLDLISGQDIETPTQAAFIPLVALMLDEAQRDAVTAEIERWLDGMVVGVPSAPAFSPAFEPKRYWRGPVWAVVNWLIADGLRLNGPTTSPAESSAGPCRRSRRPASASISIRRRARASAATPFPGPPRPISSSTAGGTPERGLPRYGIVLM